MPTQVWKYSNGLEFYFNCHSSPDLSPIENSWQPAKQRLHKYLHWDDHTTRELIYDGWTHVSQLIIINEKVANMPGRGFHWRRKDDRLLIVVVAIVVIVVNQLESWSICGCCEIRVKIIMCRIFLVPRDREVS